MRVVWSKQAVNFGSGQEQGYGDEEESIQQWPAASSCMEKRKGSSERGSEKTQGGMKALWVFGQRLLDKEMEKRKMIKYVFLN